MSSKNIVIIGSGPAAQEAVKGLASIKKQVKITVVAGNGMQEVAVMATYFINNIEEYYKFVTKDVNAGTFQKEMKNLV